MNKTEKNAHNNKKQIEICSIHRNREKVSGIFMEDKTKKQEKEKQVEYGIEEVGEDATKYGEFISSYFAWVSLPEQKEKVEELEDITKEEENKAEK